MLPDKLVEGQMILDVVEDLAPEFEVSIDVDVCCLTFHVLRVIYTTDGSVQPLAPEPAADLDRSFHCHAERFKHIGAEIHKIYNLLNARFIVDASRFGGFAGIHLFYREVHSDGDIHN